MLMVSEMFYSIQGEGPHAGVPAVFLRLTGCNLTCKGFSYKDPVTKEHLGCDTKNIWMQGKKVRPSDLLDTWQEKGWIEKLKRGAHLIITGGEPLLQSPGLLSTLEFLKRAMGPLFIELETNGTIDLTDELMPFMTHINVSPKLDIAGDPFTKRYRKKSLSTFASLSQAHFKFVISSESDIQEIQERYSIPFNIPCDRIWLMSEGATTSELMAQERQVVEWGKHYGYGFSPRLHIHLWGNIPGV